MRSDASNIRKFNDQQKALEARHTFFFYIRSLFWFVLVVCMPGICDFLGNGILYIYFYFCGSAEDVLYYSDQFSLAQFFNLYIEIWDWAKKFLCIII